LIENIPLVNTITSSQFPALVKRPANVKLAAGKGLLEVTWPEAGKRQSNPTLAIFKLPRHEVIHVIFGLHVRQSAEHMLKIMIRIYVVGFGCLAQAV
jgi:hypothetical protein